MAVSEPLPPHVIKNKNIKILNITLTLGRNHLNKKRGDRELLTIE